MPRRKLVLLILGIAVAPLITLLWVGARLLEQDRLLEAQQAQQRVERGADLVVAALQRALSASEQRLAAGAEDWPEGAVALVIRDGRVEAHPSGRSAYLPVVPNLPEAPGALFEAGEKLEFQAHDHAAAAAAFRELAASREPSVRAAALLRLGRNLAGSGQAAQALLTYAQLAAIDSAAITGVPAGLIGQFARCDLLEKLGRADELRAEGRRLNHDLHTGRWALIAPVYWLYSPDAARWAGEKDGGPDVLADALAAVWERWKTLASSGQEALPVDGKNVTVLWQTSGGAFKALVAAPEFLESQWLPAAAAVAGEQRISFRLGDIRTAATRRSARDSGLPWDLAAVADSPAPDRAFALRRRLLIAGFLVLAAMALAASYMIFRAVSRELAVARLQSDFVAAVSHEFRTPLTSLRQFTDMLREHPRLDEDRRGTCYEAQSRATERLTRLVESLLDFGRMEAGARRYRFEICDCTELVRRVVEDFQREAAAHEIRFHSDASQPVETDAEALARAVWNLLDNAVKYSPDDPAIDVDLNRRNGDVRIAVRDGGIGIPAAERGVIFTKFQRGEQARERGIKGTGIGLAMVDEIVKAHHGRVEVESQPGKGSTFTIVLPARS